MGFLNKHLHKAREKHANNQALQAAVVDCHYVFDKYYTLIDQTPIYNAAALLHPSRRLNYLDKVWKKAWVKPRVTLVRHLFETLYKDKHSPLRKNTLLRYFKSHLNLNYGKETLQLALQTTNSTPLLMEHLYLPTILLLGGLIYQQANNSLVSHVWLLTYSQSILCQQTRSVYSQDLADRNMGASKAWDIVC